MDERLRFGIACGAAGAVISGAIVLVLSGFAVGTAASVDASARSYELGAARAISADGTRRMLVAIERNTTNSQDGEQGNGVTAFETKFCSEPPPDAIASIASLLSQAAWLKGGIGDEEQIGMTLDLNSASNFISNAQNVFDRSQGIQALRDGMYRLCEGVANGIIDRDQFTRQMTQLIATLNFVVPIEICSKHLRDVAFNLSAGTSLEFIKDTMDTCLEKGEIFGNRLLEIIPQVAQFQKDAANARLAEAELALKIEQSRLAFERERRRTLELLETTSAPSSGPADLQPPEH